MEQADCMLPADIFGERLARKLVERTVSMEVDVSEPRPVDQGPLSQHAANRGPQQHSIDFAPSNRGHIAPGGDAGLNRRIGRVD